MFAIILWDRLDDFINEEQHNPQFPCKYTKDILGVNLLSSLRTPCATSSVLLLRHPLLSMF